MKKFFLLIPIILLVIVFAVLFLTVLSSKTSQNKDNLLPSSKNEAEKAAFPEQTVLNFYDKLLKSSNNTFKLKTYLVNPYLTDTFKKKLDKLFLKRITYDPLFCADEKPNSIEIGKAEELKGTIKIVINKIYSKEKIPHVVYLVNEKGFKISDIDCLNN